MQFALLFSLALCANAAVPPELLEIGRAMQSVTTLQASLEQEKEIAVLADVQKTKGTFAFARPRKLAMDLGGNTGTRLVIDGDVMTLQHKALNKVDTVRLSQDPRSRAVADHLFLLLDADPRALANVYAITVKKTSPLVVEMKPQAQGLAKIIAKVRATFDARGFVSELVLYESNGDLTRWRFGKPTINAPVANSVFAEPKSAQ